MILFVNSWSSCLLSSGTINFIFVYAYKGMCYTHVWIHECTHEGQRSMLGVFLDPYPPYFFGSASPIESSTHLLITLARHLLSPGGSTCFYLPQFWLKRPAPSSLGFNSVPHVYSASILSTEPSFQPWIFHFLYDGSFQGLFCELCRVLLLPIANLLCNATPECLAPFHCSAARQSVFPLQ